MGVPSFYRWLVEKYPKIVTPAVEEEDYDGECRPVGPADADVCYDNLYLDMNGIIHPCFHPEDQTGCPPPATFDEVFRSMFDYIDRLLRIARPRRLLYLAVDGVAPRAKMNQQRARRFKSAKAAKEAETEENLLRERFRAQGKELLPQDQAPREVSDPNIITPGTEFMEKLSVALEYYVRTRLNNHPRWKDIKVILSDANVPGEGEHKIMSFIRAQRSMGSYDPNTRHCLYGLDADLIMLGLASHEVHFSILREDVLRQHHQPENCVPVTEASSTAQELPKVKGRGWFPRITQAKPEGKLPKKPYQFLNIWVLREYLELEMTIPGCKQDIERLIDDFIFICFLTGNDFIPHIPSIEIHEFGVDLLIDVYKSTFNKMGGYIVDTDKIKEKHAACLKVSRLEKFFHELALHEEKIFLKRYELREKLLRKIQREAAENDWNERNYDIVGVAKLPFIDVNLLLSATKVVEKDLALHEMKRNTIRQEKIFLRNSNALANNAAFTEVSKCTAKKLIISTRSALFFNPDAAMPISRLLDNVRLPDKSECVIRERPMWHTYPGPRPPTCRPDTMWKASSSAMQPREEVRNAGTGWMGRGRGSPAATATNETRQIGRSSYGRERGNAAGAGQTLQRWTGSYGRGSEGGQYYGDGGAYSFRPGGNFIVRRDKL
ncbi:hypothetical protein ACQ4PT_043709 [Festuca glaucescens]